MRSTYSSGGSDRVVCFTNRDPEDDVGIARNHHGTGVTRGLPFSSMKALYAFAGVSPVFLSHAQHRRGHNTTVRL